MSEVSLQASRFLLADNAAECSAVAAHYLQMVPQYRDLGNKAGMHYSLKCAVAHVKAAVASFKELEALDAPAEVHGGAK
jgi:hypothetical protein